MERASILAVTTPVRANDFSQSWLDAPRMLPSMWASGGESDRCLP